MPPRRSTRSTRPSEGGSQSSPNPNRKVGIRRTRDKTERAGSKKSKAHYGDVDTNDEGGCSITDIISNTPEAQNASIDQQVNAVAKKRAGTKKSKAHNRADNTICEGGRDVIDSINNVYKAQTASTAHEVNAVVVHRGGCDSDEDSHSVSSLASGPSALPDTTEKNLRPPSAMCSACRTLHQRAKRMKVPIKDKLSDKGEYTGCVA